MTPELRARFELTVKAGEEVVLPYTGIDFRLDLVDAVYFVNVRFVGLKHLTVYCHAVARTGELENGWYELREDDPLALAAIERAKA